MPYSVLEVLTFLKSVDYAKIDLGGGIWLK